MHVYQRSRSAARLSDLPRRVGRRLAEDRRPPRRRQARDRLRRHRRATCTPPAPTAASCRAGRSRSSCCRCSIPRATRARATTQAPAFTEPARLSADVHSPIGATRRRSATSTATASPRWWSADVARLRLGAGTPTAASVAGFPVELDARHGDRSRIDARTTSWTTASSPRRCWSTSTATASSRSSPPAWTRRSTRGRATARTIAGFPRAGAGSRRSDRPMPRQRERIMTTPAVGDLNGDGMPDIVVGTNENYNDAGPPLRDRRRGRRPGGRSCPAGRSRVVSTRFLPVVGAGAAQLARDGRSQRRQGARDPRRAASPSTLRVYDAQRQAVRARRSPTSATRTAPSRTRKNATEFMMVVEPGGRRSRRRRHARSARGRRRRRRRARVRRRRARATTSSTTSARGTRKTGKYKNGFPQRHRGLAVLLARRRSPTSTATARSR